MRCPEFRDVMRSFLDGETDGKTRKEVGMHLVECKACADLIEQDRFWDDALRRHLDHGLPDGLRASILGEAAHDASPSAPLRLGWRKQMSIAWWAIRRDLSRPWPLLRAVAGSLLLMAVMLYVPQWLDRDEPEAAPFEQAGPIMHIYETDVPQTDENVTTARLSLSGRLI